MPSNEAILLAKIEVDVKNAAKQMEKVGLLAERSVRNIEQSFKKANPKLPTKFVTGFGAALSTAFGVAVVKEIRGAISAVADLADESQKLGIGTKFLQEFGYAVKLSGGSAEAASAGLTKFTKNLSDAAQGSGDLYKIFQANGVAVKDAAGNIISGEDALKRFADLIQNTKDPADQLNLAVRVLGKAAGPDLLNALKSGSEGLETAAKKANELGIVLGDDVVKKAAALDDKFDELTLTASAWGKELAVGVADYVLPAIEKAYAALKEFSTYFQGLGSQTNEVIQNKLSEARAQLEIAQKNGQTKANVVGFRSYGSTGQNAQAQISALEAELSRRSEELRETNRASGRRGASVVQPMNTQDKGARDDRPTVIPKLGGGGGGGGSKKQSFEEDFAQDIAGYRARTEAIVAETQAVGLSVYAREKAQAIIELEQRALEQLQRTQGMGAQLSAQQKAAIEAEADARARATQGLEDAQEKYQQLQEMQQAFADLAFSGIEGLIDGSKSLNDVLTDTLKTLAKMALQAALLGQGPLAGLFGTASAGGGVGGLFGGLMSFFADGGHVAGPGTGRSDSVPAMLSNGEFVVNAQATRQNRQLLEAINSGRLPKFADGGLVVPSMPKIPTPAQLGRRGGGGSTMPAVNINIDARGADSAVEARLKAYFASERPKIVKEAMESTARTARRAPGFLP